MQVRDVMTDYVLATTLDAKLRVARDAMERHGIRHLPVVDDSQVIGMISKRELASAATVANYFDADREAYETFLDIPVRQFLQTRFSAEHDVHAVSPDAPLASAVDVLVAHRLSALPVVDQRGELIGIISYIDILEAVRGMLDHSRE